MDIDFDSLRKRACLEYDRLAKYLNERLSEPPLEDDEIVIWASDIKNSMDSLRQCLILISCVYDDAAGINDISSEIGQLEIFN